MVNRAFIFVLLAGTIILLIVLRIQGAELVTPVSPLGILSLEFSGDAKNTELIVSTWKNGMELHLPGI